MAPRSVLVLLGSFLLSGQASVLRGSHEGHQGDVNDLLKIFDKDGDGYMSDTEIQAGFDLLAHEHHNIKEADEHIALFDTDGDGKLNYEEFQKMIPKDD